MWTFWRHIQQKACLWCRNFVILYKVLLKLLLLWCTACCHFTLFSTVAGPQSSSSPPPPFHSVSFHCAGFLDISSLVQWHGHPSEQCVQYLIPNYKSWEASTRFHVASASPAVAAARGVYVQLTVASCFLILQEPSWDYRIVQVEGTISSCHWVYASIQIADFLVRKSQSCSGFCLYYYKMCSITLFCSLHFHTENTLVFPRKPYCVIWSERMKCF